MTRETYPSLRANSTQVTSIELRHLRYFVAAVEHGSFRKASAALGVQESAVSRRIRDLEDHLGASVFQRYNGGVQLTLAGERFLHRAKRALRHVHEGVGSAAAIGRSDEGRVKIGIFSSIASGFLPTLFNTFAKLHPSVDVELIEGNPSEHIAAIRQLRLDVAFITGTTHWPGCDTEQFWSERVFVVLPCEHPLSAKVQIDWIDLAGQKFMVSDAAPGQEIHDYLVQRLAELGRHPEIRRQFIGRDSLLASVSVGRGLTVASEATTAMQLPGIAYRPIRDEILPFSAVWSTNNDNPAARRLLSVARTLAGSKTLRASRPRS
ncbi:LysR family transcriptional regulator [Bradyrhizobium sp. Pha-3]|uniref:LysR family transcriptional regulator n=1 Tax=Bradyrhizobium sp. Pha-3 TaxID=208375 RepID=UPI0035D4C074